MAEKPEGKGLGFPRGSGLSARCVFVGRADWEGVQKAQAGVRGKRWGLKAWDPKK